MSRKREEPVAESKMADLTIAPGGGKKVLIKALEIQVEGYFDNRGNLGVGRSRGFDSIRYDIAIPSLMLGLLR